MEEPKPKIIDELKKAATSSVGIVGTAVEGTKQITGSTATAVDNAIKTFDNLQGVVKTVGVESQKQIENISDVARELESSIGSAGSTVINTSGSAVGSVIGESGTAASAVIGESGAAASAAIGSVKQSITEGSKSIFALNNILLNVLDNSKENIGESAEKSTQALANTAGAVATLTSAVSEIASATKQSAEFSKKMISFTTTLVTATTDKITNILTQPIPISKKQELIKGETKKEIEAKKREFRTNMSTIIKEKTNEANGYIRLLNNMNCNNRFFKKDTSDRCSENINKTSSIIPKINTIGYSYLAQLATIFTTAPTLVDKIQTDVTNENLDELKNTANSVVLEIVTKILSLIDKLINTLDKIIDELKYMVDPSLVSNTNSESTSMGGKRKSKRRAFKKRRSTRKNRSTKKHK
jgi:hypothetical protein